MSKTKRKPHPFKVKDSNPQNGICECSVKGVIAPNCFEVIGVCPALKILAVFEGYRIPRINIQ